MSNFNVPVGQIAYQAIMAKQLQASFLPYVRTINRYAAGPVGSQINAQTGSISPMAQMLVGCGRFRRPMLIGGNAVTVSSTGGGVNYANSDLVTFSPVNGGRSIVAKVITNAGGNPTLMEVIDPGSGLLGGGTGVSSLAAQTAALNQLSTTGTGSGAGWQATVATGWGAAQPRPNA